MKVKLKKHPVLSISILALIFRILIILLFNPTYVTGDENTYLAVANHLFKEHKFVYTRKDYKYLWTDQIYGIKPPLYPFFLDAIFTLFNTQSREVIILIQVLMSSLTGILIYRITEELMDKKIALFALCIYSFYWETALMSVVVLSEGIYWFLLSLLLYLLIKRSELWSYIVIGIALGLLTLIRPPSIIFMAIIFFWIWSKFRLAGISRLLTAGMLCVLTLAPWTLRNYSIYHRFVFIYTDGGINLWMGNFKDSGGSYNFPDPNDPNQTPNLKSTGPQKELERDSFYDNQAYKYMMTYPTQALSIDVAKIFRSFSVHRPAILNTTSSRGVLKLIPVTLGIDTFFQFLVSYQFVAINILFFISVIMLSRYTSAGLWLLNFFILFHLFTIFISHYEDRYIMLMYPLMIPFAAVSLSKLFQVFKKPLLS